MMNTNNMGLNVRNIIGQNRMDAVQRGGRNPLNFSADNNGLISAIIQQKDANATILAMADGQDLSVASGQVVGNVGDEVFFQQNGENSLKQVFPNINGQNVFGKQLSLQSVQDLMKHSDFARPSEGALDISADLEARLEKRQTAANVANRLARNIGRISGNVHSAAVAQLAAEGINIDKISIPVLDGVVSKLDAAKAHNDARIADEIGQKVAGVSDLSDGQIAQMLANETPITLDNLYIYKHSGAEATGTPMTQADWDGLQEDIARFLQEQGLEKNAENMARVRLILDNQIPLTDENFDKLIFLQDVQGNVDIPSLVDAGAELDYNGRSIGELNVYDPVKDAIFKAETRLAMSYEASTALLSSDLEIDLDPQIEALKALKAQEQAITASLKQVNADTDENFQKMADTFKAIHTMPYVSMATYGAMADDMAKFTMSVIEQHITSHKYEENATVANLKYGDTSNKIAEQFAPMLREIGFGDDKYTIRAAKILTANNMDINAENLAKIKDMDAKITDIQTKLHPRVAAQMVAEGLNPAGMHMDEVLEYVEKHTQQYGTADHEQLLENIAKMDRQGDIDPETRNQIMDIYKMLHKISKNNGAGVGYAVNAGVELTLENLLDFSKNFDESKGKNNTLNYATENGVYFAKHLVSSFIASAKPAPMVAFVKQEPLSDTLPQSLEKLEEIAKKELQAEGELDLAKINASIKELSGTGKEALRTLTAMGIPVTLANLRQLKATKDKQLENEINSLDTDETAELLEILPTSDDIASIDPIATNQAMSDKIEEMIENTDDASKITQMDLVMKNLQFRQMLHNSGADFSFGMNFNGRMADVKLHLLNDNVDISTGVNIFMSLNTAMGEVEGFVKMQGNRADISISAEGEGLAFLKANRGILTDILGNLGIDDIRTNFLDKNYFRNQLSRTDNLPKY
ncbi:MAG: DUF6240 domain-containing protein [Defluviitaleaceae bacterium]|nr:DUF6240 domain-containing protein [Defluviitaleaceae bacterium]